MCKRICNKCGSTNHTEQYGMMGMYYYCDDCPNILEFQYDIEWAPRFDNYEKTEEYARSKSFVNSPILED